MAYLTNRCGVSHYRNNRWQLLFSAKKKKAPNVYYVFFRNAQGEHKSKSQPTSCSVDGPLQRHALKPLINQTSPALSWSLLSPYVNFTPHQHTWGLSWCSALHYPRRPLGVLKGRREINLKVYFTSIVFPQEIQEVIYFWVWKCQCVVFAVTRQDNTKI